MFQTVNGESDLLSGDSSDVLRDTKIARRVAGVCSSDNQRPRVVVDQVLAMIPGCDRNVVLAPVNQRAGIGDDVARQGDVVAGECCQLAGRLTAELRRHCDDKHDNDDVNDDNNVNDDINNVNNDINNVNDDDNNVNNVNNDDNNDNVNDENNDNVNDDNNNSNDNNDDNDNNNNNNDDDNDFNDANGPTLWNCLPLNIRNSQTIYSF